VTVCWVYPETKPGKDIELSDDVTPRYRDAIDLWLGCDDVATKAFEFAMRHFGKLLQNRSQGHF